MTSTVHTQTPGIGQYGAKNQRCVITYNTADGHVRCIPYALQHDVKRVNSIVSGCHENKKKKKINMLFVAYCLVFVFPYTRNSMRQMYHGLRVYNERRKDV